MDNNRNYMLREEYEELSQVNAKKEMEKRLPAVAPVRKLGKKRPRFGRNFGEKSVHAAKEMACVELVKMPTRPAGRRKVSSRKLASNREVVRNRNQETIQMSVEDAIMYFVQEHHKHELLYFKVNGKKDNPYDLQRVEKDDDDVDFIMSKSALMQHRDQTECIRIDDWVYQSQLYQNITLGISLFHAFQLRKILVNWAKNTKQLVFGHVREQLEQNLLLARPSYTATLLQMVSSGFEVASMQPIALSRKEKDLKSISFEAMRAAQKMKLDTLMEDIGLEHHQVEKAIYFVSQLIQTNQQVQPIVEQQYQRELNEIKMIHPKWRSSPISMISQTKNAMGWTKIQAKQDKVLMADFKKLLYYFYVGNFYQLALHQVQGVLQQIQNASCTPLNVTLQYTPQLQVQYYPSENDILHYFSDTINEFFHTLHKATRFALLNEEMAVPYCLSLQYILASDTTVKNYRKNLSHQLKLGYIAANQASRAFSSITPVVQHIAEFNPKDSKLEIITPSDEEDMVSLVQNIQKRILKYQDWIQVCQKLQVSYCAKFMDVNCKPMTRELIEKLGEYKLCIYQYLDEILVSSINHQVSWLKSTTAMYDERPQNLENFCRQLSDIRNAIEPEKAMHTDIRGIDNLFKALKDSSFLSSFMLQYNIMHQLVSKLMIAQVSNKKFRIQTTPLIKDQLEALFRKYKVRCEQILEVVSSKDFIFSEHDIPERLVVISTFKSEVLTIENKLKQLRSYQNLLGIKDCPFEELERLNYELELVGKLWGYAKQWQLFTAEIHNMPFTSINWSEKLKALVDFQVQLTTLHNNFETDLGEDTLEEISTIVDEFQIVVPLSSSNMEKRHWEQVFALLDYVPQAESTTMTPKPNDTPCSLKLQDLKDKSFQDFSAEIMSICRTANREKEIQDKYQALKSFWLEHFLELSPFEGTYKIDQQFLDHISAKLDDDLIVLESMLKAVANSEMHDTLLYWCDELVYFHQTFEKWASCQLKFWSINYVLEIPDIRENLACTCNEFEIFSLKWKSTLNRMNTVKKIKACLRKVATLEYFQEADILLEQVWKHLSEYLQEKRKVFARFHFVSDNDLIEIIAASQRAYNITNVISICYQHIEGLQMSDIVQPNKRRNNKLGSALIPGKGLLTLPSKRNKHEKNTNLGISKFYGKAGECVELAECLPISSNPEVWMPSFDRSIKQTIRNGLCEAISLISNIEQSLNAIDNGQFFKSAAHFPAQALIISGRICWTATCVAEFSKASPNWDSVALIWVDKIRHFTKGLTSRLGSQLRLRDDNLYLAFILQLKNQYRQIQIFKDRQVQHITDFAWCSSMRYNWCTQSMRCSILHSQSSYMYGSEYTSEISEIVTSPTTDRAILSLSVAIRLYCGSVLLGRPGEGKRSLLNSFSFSLGREYINVHCSRETTSQQYSRFLIGMIQSDLWICFSGLKTLNSGSLSILAHQLHAIHMAFAAHCTSMHIGGHSVKLHNFVSYLARIDVNHDMNHTALLRNLGTIGSLFLPISCVQANISILLEAYFSAYNFDDPVVATRVVCTVFHSIEANEVYFKGITLSAISAMRLMHYVSKLKSSSILSSEKSIVVHSMWKSLACRVMPDHKRKLEIILRQTYPTFKSTQLPDINFILVKRKVTEHMKQCCMQNISIFVHQVSQLHQNLQEYPVSVLVGAAYSGKTEVLKCFKSVCEMPSIQSNDDSSVSSSDSDTDACHIKFVRLCSESFKLETLYGSYSTKKAKWVDGILSIFVGVHSHDNNTDRITSCLVLDGKVDPAYMEPLTNLTNVNNTVGLPNGSYLSLGNTKLVLETTELGNWAPTAIGSFGILYIANGCVLFSMLIKSWTLTETQREPQCEQSILYFGCLLKNHARALFDGYQLWSMHPQFESILTLVQKCLGVISIFLPDIAKLKSSSKADLEFVFAFAVTASFGSLIKTNAHRGMFHCRLLKFLPNIFDHSLFKFGMLIFDLCIELENGYLVKTTWRSRIPYVDFSTASKKLNCISMPSEKSVACEYAVQMFVKAGMNVLLLGSRGTGKSATIRTALHCRKLQDYQIAKIFATNTSSAGKIQRQMLAQLQRKQQSTFGPPSGSQRIVYCIEDINMSASGCVELFRQFLDSKQCFSREMKNSITVRDHLIVASYNISPQNQWDKSCRLQRHFYIVCKERESHEELQNMFAPVAASCMHAESDLQLGSAIPCDSWKKIILFVVHLYDECQKACDNRHKQHYLTIYDLLRTLVGVLTPNIQEHRSYESVLALVLDKSKFYFQLGFLNDYDKFEYNTMVKRIAQKHGMDRWTSFENIARMASQLYVVDSTGFRGITYEHGGEMFMEAAEKCSFYCTTFASALHYETKNELSEAGKLEGMHRIFDKLVPFSDAVQQFLHVRRCLVEAECKNLILVGNRGCGKATCIRVACSSLAFKLLDIWDDTCLNDLRTMVIQAGTKRKQSVCCFHMDNYDQLKSAKIFKCILAILRSSNPSILTEIFGFSSKDVGTIINDISKHFSSDARQDEMLELFWTNVTSVLRICIISNERSKVQNMLSEFPITLKTLRVECLAPWSKSSILQVTTGLGSLKEYPMLRSINNTVRMDRVMFQIWTIFSYLQQYCSLTEVSCNFRSFLDVFELLYSSHFKELDKMYTIVHDTASILDTDMEYIRHLRVKKGLISTSLDNAILHRKQSLRLLEQGEANVLELRQKFVDNEANCKKVQSEIKMEHRAVQAELDSATPAFQRSLVALNSLRKRQISEMKSWGNPPEMVRSVLEAVCILLRRPPTWPSAQRLLAEPGFLDALKKYDRKLPSNDDMSKLINYIAHPSFSESHMKRVSPVACSLCLWVLAIVQYFRVQIRIKPRKLRIAENEVLLKSHQVDLELSSEKLNKNEDKLRQLLSAHQEDFRAEASIQEEHDSVHIEFNRITRVMRVIEDERKKLDDTLLHLCQNKKLCLVTSILLAGVLAFLCHLPSENRVNIIEKWIRKIQLLNIDTPDSIQHALVCCVSAGSRYKWLSAGIVDHPSMILNAWIATSGINILHQRSSLNGHCYPLIVDPQGTAVPFFRTIYKTNIEVLQANSPNFEYDLQNAIERGTKARLVIENAESISLAAFKSLLKHAEFHYDGHLVLVSRQLVSRITNYPMIHQINFEPGVQAMEQVLLSVFVKSYDYSSFVELQENYHELSIKHEALSSAHTSFLNASSKRTQPLICSTTLVDEFLELLRVVNNKRNEVEDASQLEKRKLLRFKSFRPIACRGSTLLAACKKLELVNMNFQYSSAHLATFWQTMCSDKINTANTNIAIAKEESRQLVVEFLRQTCLGLPPHLHRLLGFQVSVMCALADGRISPSIATTCLQVYSVIDNAKAAGNILHSTEFDVENRVATSFVKSILSKSLNKIRKQTTCTVSLQHILRGKYQLFTNRDGKAYSPTIQNMMYRLRPHRSLQFISRIICHISMSPDLWSKFASDEHAQFAALPSTIRTSISAFEYFILATIVQNNVSLTHVDDLIQVELGAHVFTTKNAIATILQEKLDSHVPVLVFIPQGEPSTFGVQAIRESLADKQSCEISEISLMGQTDSAISHQLLAIPQASSVGGWYIIKDLHAATSKALQMLVHTIETIADPSLLCGATFKVWIVSTIDCRVQGNIFSFCRHIYISTSTSLSIADIQSAHWSITSKFEMPSAVVSAVLCHALLTTWQEYGSHGSGWLLDYSFSGKDFDRMLLAVDSSLHTEAQWESALHSAFVVYAGKIPFYWEQEGLFEFFLHCFSPMKTKNVVEPDMLKLSISRWKQDELSAGSIGLSGAEQCKTTTNTFQFLHCLRQISASTTVQRYDSRQRLRATLWNIECQLPHPNVFKNTLRSSIVMKLFYNGYSPSEAEFAEFLLAEVATMETYLHQIWTFLRSSLRLCESMSNTIPEEALQIVHDKIPPSWHTVSYACPHNLTHWLQWVSRSVAFFVNWIHYGKPRTFWCPAICNIKGLLTVVKTSYSLDTNSFLGDVHLQTAPIHVLENDVYSICLTGLQLRAAQYDEASGLLQSKASTSPLFSYIDKIALQPSLQYSNYYDCPIYRQLSWTSHAENTVAGFISLTTKCPKSLFMEANVVLVFCAFRPDADAKLEAIAN